MKRPHILYRRLNGAVFVLPSAERIKMRTLRSLTITQAPAQPGYLNDGEPFALRKAPIAPRRRTPCPLCPSLRIRSRSH